FDLLTMTFRFKIDFDSIAMSAPILAEGHIAHIPIQGKGFARQLVLAPVSAMIEIKGNMRQLRGIQYYNPKKVKVNLDLGEAGYYITGLFDNNEHLGNKYRNLVAVIFLLLVNIAVRLTNRMFNENSDMVVEALTPALERLAEAA
ncbi:hypothetical protein ILUMI_17790, partial [Ignelater luminosus]